ncbi:putative ethyl tert-butyl ether degradation protein [Pseudonocardia sp. Ae168_Ps1]|nr:putative ethyl tert-butyl ether degradation protein [Pseudonocardia sp. Ae150A_Ps1]OLL79636.1 putative ethyl tert-butyl ether degradation protein [Pseudonocardia sp. Ae168_Ps1]OLL86226.1 putative ethyl tert-butyl ether degradation protein [Pseudonocardia sp. Ae263_Ps1]OLL93743.1 putative ethyl tert-butyl ether degradation protein [Pseudonocardia sp. Ae356_Ps1]
MRQGDRAGAPRLRRRRRSRIVYQLTVLYHHPDDPKAFDEYYDGTHTPLAKALPGLQRLTVSRPQPAPDGAQPAYHLVATLEFADQAAFGAAMGSPEGEAAVADVGKFATGGATMLTGPSTAP